jgi:hypothetical protein
MMVRRKEGRKKKWPAKWRVSQSVTHNVEAWNDVVQDGGRVSQVNENQGGGAKGQNTPGMGKRIQKGW